MARAPQLKNVMTPFPYSVDVEAPVSEAERFMREHKIRHLPVMDKGVLKGVVSDRDIKLMLGPDFAYPNPRELKVGNVMIEDCYVVDLATPLHGCCGTWLSIVWVRRSSRAAASSRASSPRPTRAARLPITSRALRHWESRMRWRDRSVRSGVETLRR
jgi:CBS domain-containing protein